MINNLASMLLNLFGTLSYAGVALAMAIESACIPLPSEIIMPLAGFLAYQHKMNLVGATLAGSVGSVVGSAVAYWVGAVGGRPLLLRYGKYILISPEDAARADNFFARRGDATVFLARLMPIVRTFISLPAGIARMNFAKFILYSFLGSLPWCFVLAYVGYKLGQHWRDVGNALHAYEGVIVVVLVVLVALYVYRHVRGRNRNVASGSEGY